MRSLPDLRTDPRAATFRKRPIPVDVSFAVETGVCLTLEGPVPYAARDALLVGIAGERWPITRSKFDAHYTAVEGTRAGTRGRYVKRPLPVRALQLQKPATVRLANGTSLRGNAGDWLLQYAPDDFGIVRGSIFQATYEAIDP